MREALMLFESITNSKYFKRSALILFLNKIDLFREKLTSGMSSICKWFPEYPGENNDILAAQEFFAQKFKNCLGKLDRDIYVHYTNATDTDLLKKTMESVQNMIVKRNLNVLYL
jgi:guanine nucleotide-binding protein subunit alpha